MENHNITSGGDYALLLISTILESERDMSESERLDSDTFLHLTKRIKEYADITWQEYIKGNRETYLFDDVEMEMIFQKAIQDTVDNLLEGLIEKEMVSIAAVSEEGELLYSLTDEGKKYADSLNPKNKKKD
jgi:hypothetical protein